MKWCVTFPDTVTMRLTLQIRSKNQTHSQRGYHCLHWHYRHTHNHSHKRSKSKLFRSRLMRNENVEIISDLHTFLIIDHFVNIESLKLIPDIIQLCKDSLIHLSFQLRFCNENESVTDSIDIDTYEPESFFRMWPRHSLTSFDCGTIAKKRKKNLRLWLLWLVLSALFVTKAISWMGIIRLANQSTIMACSHFKTDKHYKDAMTLRGIRSWKHAWLAPIKGENELKRENGFERLYMSCTELLKDIKENGI